MADEARYVYRFLDETGNGSGNRAETGDYSSGPQFFKVNSPTQGFFGITTFAVQIQSSGMMTGDGYGDGPALTNGIIVGVFDVGNNLLIDFTDGNPIKTNSDWAKVADVEMLDFGPGASGDQYMNIRWPFAASGQPVFIAGDAFFGVKLNDDFSGLVSKVARVQGFFSITAQTVDPRIFRVK